MPEQTCAVILAGGEGKRMKSNHPKVLASVLFKPMLQWVMDAAEGAGVKELCVVTGHKHEQVEAYLQAAQKPGGANLHHVLQAEQRGTGHAVMMAEPFCARTTAGTRLSSTETRRLSARRCSKPP
ncbi:MAG: NTP transferase domain-containing protein [Anaeromassilibacillus sp.]